MPMFVNVSCSDGMPNCIQIYRVVFDNKYPHSLSVHNSMTESNALPDTSTAKNSSIAIIMTSTSVIKVTVSKIAICTELD